MPRLSLLSPSSLGDNGCCLYYFGDRILLYFSGTDGGLGALADLGDKGEALNFYTGMVYALSFSSFEVLAGFVGVLGVLAPAFSKFLEIFFYFFTST